MADTTTTPITNDPLNPTSSQEQPPQQSSAIHSVAIQSRTSHCGVIGMIHRPDELDKVNMAYSSVPEGNRVVRPAVQVEAVEEVEKKSTK